MENYFSGYLAVRLGLEGSIASAFAGAAGPSFNPLCEGLNRIAMRLLEKRNSPRRGAKRCQLDDAEPSPHSDREIPAEAVQVSLRM